MTAPEAAAPQAARDPHAPTPLEARLEALRARGAERHDPPGFRFIASLLSSARALGDGARARLEARAQARLDKLEAAFAQARADAAAHVGALGEAGVGAAERAALDRALQRGELADAARAARRRLRELAAEQQKTAVPWLARLRGEAASRDVRLPEPLARDLEALARDGDVVERRAKRRAQALGNAVSTALFRETLVSARAALAVARAADNLPEDAGPYNPHVLAARALAAADRLSPVYLRALVTDLQDLASLAAAFEPAPGKSAGKPARKKAPAKTEGADVQSRRPARGSRRASDRVSK